MLQTSFQLENPVIFSSQDDQHVAKQTVSNTPLQTVTGLVTKRDSNLPIDNENFSTKASRQGSESHGEAIMGRKYPVAVFLYIYKLQDLRFWCQKQDNNVLETL